VALARGSQTTAFLASRHFDLVDIYVSLPTGRQASMSIKTPLFVPPGRSVGGGWNGANYGGGGSVVNMVVFAERP